MLAGHRRDSRQTGPAKLCRVPDLAALRNINGKVPPEGLEVPTKHELRIKRFGYGGHVWLQFPPGRALRAATDTNYNVVLLFLNDIGAYDHMRRARFFVDYLFENSLL